MSERVPSEPPEEGVKKMAYDSRHDVPTERDRDVIVTTGGPNNNSGMVIAAILAVVAILFVAWLFLNNGAADTTGDPASPVETTQPADTTAPVETTLPTDTTTP